jgi:hypothetical protein
MLQGGHSHVAGKGHELSSYGTESGDQKSAAAAALDERTNGAPARAAAEGGARSALLKARKWFVNNGHHLLAGELEAELRELFGISDDEIAELVAGKGEIQE